MNRDEDLTLYRELVRRTGLGERQVLATVVATRGSTPRKAGTRMLVDAAGRGVVGTVGGGCGEGQVLDAAREVLASGRPRTVHIDLTEDLLSWSPAVCGGVMEVWVEVIDPLPPPGWVHIHYLRPPDRLTVFRQELVHEGEDGIVTLARAVALPAPLRAGGEVILDPGAPALWFTFPGVPHDIGRFHRADGSFTGWYANLLTPVVIEPGHVWRTTDLRLDVWLPEGAAHPLLLDEDELAEAVDAGWIDPAHAALAREEATRIMTAAATGSWPPPIAREWTLKRALDRLAGG